MWHVWKPCNEAPTRNGFKTMLHIVDPNMEKMYSITELMNVIANNYKQNELMIC